MSDIWIATIKTPAISSVLYCNSEDSVVENLCNMIYNDIGASCDLTDLSTFTDVTIFNSKVIAGKYKDAIVYWNACTSSAGSNYSYTPDVVFSMPATINFIDPVKLSQQTIVNKPSPTTIPSFGMWSSWNISVLPSSNSIAQKTISQDDNGATCRKCKTLNPHANSDGSDGTYICYSCKI